MNCVCATRLLDTFELLTSVALTLCVRAVVTDTPTNITDDTNIVLRPSKY